MKIVSNLKGCELSIKLRTWWLTFQNQNLCLTNGNITRSSTDPKRDKFNPSLTAVS